MATSDEKKSPTHQMAIRLAWEMVTWLDQVVAREKVLRPDTTRSDVIRLVLQKAMLEDKQSKPSNFRNVMIRKLPEK
jgi:hypothetical protein